MSKSTHQQSEERQLSEGHYGLVDDTEYFVFNGTLYRAPVTNAIDRNGYRCGGREVLPMRLIDNEYLNLLGL